MKQKKVLSLVGVLMVAGLVSCNRTSDSTPTSSKGADVSEITKGFATSFVGTASVTYNASFKVDINANGGSANMDSFKRDIESVTTADIDTTDGNFYVKVTNTTTDKRNNNTKTVSEGLLYKDTDGKYYSLTTKSTAPAEVATSDVTSTINSLLSTISHTQVGGFDLDSLVYKTDKSYELSQFGMTDTFTADDLNDPEYEANDKGGIKVTYAPSYIGYQTDNGISDFKSKKDGDSGKAADVVLNTNEKGYVLSYTETFTDPGLDMPIMTPAPTVLITGKRTLTSTIGASLTKVSTIDHNTDTAYVNVKRNDNNVISVSGKFFTLNGMEPGPMEDMEFNNNSSSVKTGANKWVALSPKLKDGFEIDYVKVNGVDAMKMAGMYCFKIENPGEFNVVVASKSSSGDVSYVTLNQPVKDEHVTGLTVQYIIAPNYQDVKDFTQFKAEFTDGFFIAVKAQFESGYTYDKVFVNDAEVTFVRDGYYCYSVKAAGAFTVKVTSKAAA